MKKIFVFFVLIYLLNSVPLAYSLTENQQTEEKEEYDRRLQDRLFQQREASELPYFRDAEIIEEKKEAQGWYEDNQLALNDPQDKRDAYKRQDEEVLEKQLEEKRIQEKIIQQQLENKRLEDLRIRKKIQDQELERRRRG